MAVYNAETMEEHLRSALFLPRLAGTLFGVFGITGLLLATVGLYGIMSYSVSLRTREIGIRIALGAQIGSVQRLIVGQGNDANYHCAGSWSARRTRSSKVLEQFPLWHSSA